MTTEGQWQTDRHASWIERQKRDEILVREALTKKTLSASADRIASGETEAQICKGEESNHLVPGRFDVLFGQNKTIRQHTGNLRAMHLVQMYSSHYENANKYQKTEVADRIVNIIIEDSQARFLRWDEDQEGWVPVDHDTAREKISHYFRYMRSKVFKSEKKGACGNGSKTKKTAPNTIKSQRQKRSKATSQASPTKPRT